MANRRIGAAPLIRKDVRPKLGGAGQVTWRLGIDLGNVLTERRGEGFKPFADDGYRSVPPLDGAFEAVHSLVEILGESNVFVVSRCSPRAQDRARDWLSVHRFHDLTRVPIENVHFCTERHEKALLAKGLRLTHFIDDDGLFSLT